MLLERDANKPLCLSYELDERKVRTQERETRRMFSGSFAASSTDSIATLLLRLKAGKALNDEIGLIAREAALAEEYVSCRINVRSDVMPMTSQSYRKGYNL